MEERGNTKMKIEGKVALFTGIGLFITSIILPLFGIPLVSLMDLSTVITASVSGAILVIGEVLGLVSVAIMGKEGYAIVKKHMAHFFKRYGPPQHVSRVRYRVGLVLFFAPILFGWMSVYVAGHLPGFTSNPLPYAITGDLSFITGLFVLGGDFWDKLRALFQHDMIVQPIENMTE